jgi:hypothetical protein
MGLSLEVGILADLNENDQEGAAHFREEFATLNRFLESEGLAPHLEPESCEVFSCAMWGYSGLHYLRRVAAHLDLKKRLPRPGDQDCSKDPVLVQYYEMVDNGSTGLLTRLFGRQPLRTFDHLIVHGDAEGFYLPEDLASVLVLSENYPIAGGMVGSSVRLRDECARLASALSLPLDIDLESDELLEAAESQGNGGQTWQRYGIESFTCLRLYHAALHSIKEGAAIVFT